MLTYAATQERSEKRFFGLCWHVVISDLGNQPTR